MTTFKSWLALHTEDEGDAGRVASLLTAIPALTDYDRSFTNAYYALVAVFGSSKPPRELHNALIGLHNAYRSETNDPEMVAIVPLAESSEMWDLELTFGYDHAGYGYDDTVDFCTTEAEIEASSKKTVLLDIRDASDSKAYRLLCDLAARAVSCGYQLRVQRFGD